MRVHVCSARTLIVRVIRIRVVHISFPHAHVLVHVSLSARVCVRGVYVRSVHVKVHVVYV